jgi:hypothetical protein
MLQTLTRHALALAFAFALACPVQADELDDKYLQVLNTVDQAEALEKAGKVEGAKAKYLAVQKSLLEIKKADPTWKANMVAYRLKEIDGKLAALSPGSTTAVGAEKTDSGAAGSTAVPASASSETKLLHAGAEPKRAVRLQPKAGDTQKLEMIMNIGMEMSMGGNQMPKMSLPVMKMPMDISVQTVSPAGEIVYTSVLGEMGIESSADEMPGVADALRAAMGGTKGVESKGVVSNRGIPKTSETKMAPDASPQMRQTLDQMKDSLAGITVPFPEEPIGVGAKWEARQVLKSQGMTIKQTTLCELVSLTADRAEVKLTQLQSAANQKIASPAMPGMKVDLDKFESSGTGKSVYDLTRVIPVSAEMNSEAQMKMGMNMGGQKQAMDMKTTSKMRLESK